MDALSCLIRINHDQAPSTVLAVTRGATKVLITTFTALPIPPTVAQMLKQKKAKS